VLLISIGLLAVGAIILQLSTTFTFSALGLITIGAGLAAGFPVALSYVGDRYAAVSGTAFSIVISIALIGSMIVNYLMGIIAERYGIHHMVTMTFALTTGMLIFSIAIIRRLGTK
jgi:hypothetical protein